MLCDSLKNIALVEILAGSRILERVELETPQIIYLFECTMCHSIHQIEFSALDGEPDFPALTTERAIEIDQGSLVPVA
ncbi:MAG: hypothetical protein ABR910_13025 [Acidobacteriaceae bacterium]|jgi:hypothetical protein